MPELFLFLLMFKQKKVQPFRGVRLEEKYFLTPLEIFWTVLLECLAPAGLNWSLNISDT